MTKRENWTWLTMGGGADNWEGEGLMIWIDGVTIFLPHLE